ncbi:MAG: DUF6785 family protein [Planctomycetota bacterium]|jgi:hypothetical protein
MKKIPLRALIIGTLFAAVFSYVAVVAGNRQGMYIPATQLSAISIIFSILLVIIRVKVFNVQEIFLIFIMATVPAGLALFGFVGNSIPFIASLNNPKWNTPQSQLDKRINPITDQNLFLGDPLFEFRDIDDWQKFSAEVIEGEGNPDSPAGRIWGYLSDENKNIFKELKGGRTPAFDEQVELGINIKNVLLKPDFYTENAFAGVKIPEQAQALIDKGVNVLDNTYELPVMNRILMESSFPETVRRSKYVEGMEAIKYYNRGMRAAGKNAFPVFVKRDDESIVDYAKSLYAYIGGNKDNRKLMGDVPWGIWLSPLLYWGAIGVALIVLFYSLNEIVFKQWYENEKLVFPIAELATAVIEPDKIGDGDGSLVPSIYKNALFWVGFAIAFLVIFYNGMVTAKWFEGLTAIDLSGAGEMRVRLEDSILGGLNPDFRLEIFFVCIGLAFLLPAEISFSAWFFFIFMRIQQLIAVWLGYGVNARSFPTNWLDKANFMTAQGGGAMEVFGFICLWKVRHKLFAFIYRLASKGNKKISDDELKEYTMPSLLFFVSSILVFYFLRSGDVTWGMCFLTYIAVLFLTISMVRLVAECGIIGFQINWGAIHILKTLSLYKFTTVFATKGLGTVMMVLSGMFIELKTFIAPTMMNGKFLAEKGKLPRKYFALALILCIGVTFAVSTITIIALANDQGVEAMNRWFYISLPSYIFKSANNISASIDSSLLQTESFFSANAAWFGVGGVSCGLIIYLRQFLFWIPHPIGLLMVVNPIMRAYWFSFLIAWICKRAAVKYCDPEGYKFIRGFFIGLILGEVIAEDSLSV